jgi:methylenetetrahydrofolate reductase (NADPH)
MNRVSSRLRQAVRDRQFIVTAEIAPPKGGDPTHMLALAEGLRDRVHAVNITDGSRAVMRMASLPAAILLQQQGIEPILQMACRDRNQIAIQADLLGAHALGIRNVLALTGDPVKAGDHPKATGVFDFESVRLLQAIAKLNSGFDINDRALTDGSTDLFPGAAVDPQSKSKSGLKRRFERKLASGVQFFQSQLISDFDVLAQFMDEVAILGDAPVLAGIFLIKSAKNARFLNKFVPGVQIPEATIERLDRADDPLREGMKIAAEQVRLAREICQGVHMMAIRREDLIPEILDMAGVAPLTSAIASGDRSTDREHPICVTLTLNPSPKSGEGL